MLPLLRCGSKRGNDSLESTVRLEATMRSRESIAQEVEVLFRELTPHEEYILRLRFGIGRGAQEIDAVAAWLSVTATAVRDIERCALRKLWQAAMMEVPSPCVYAG